MADPQAPTVDSSTPAAVAPAAAPATPAPAAATPDQQAALANSRSEMAQSQAALSGVNPNPATLPPVKHARLLAMVSGLAQGLSAAGAALSSGGKEGGAAQVQQMQQAAQDQRIKQQQAATEQRNAENQQKYMLASTHASLSDSWLKLMTLQDDMELKHVQVAAAKQGLSTGAVALQNARNDSIQQWGVDPLAAPSAAGQTQNVEGATKATQQLINFASDPRVLGPDNPAVKTATDALAAAQKAGDVTAIIGATAGLRRAITYQQEAVESGIKLQTQAESAPLGPKADQLNTALLQRYQVLHPKATELPSGYKLTADSMPKDFDRVDRIMQQSEAAEGTEQTRALTNAIHEETLDALRGPQGIDPNLQGTDYLNAMAVKDPGQADMIKAYGQGRLVLSPNIARSPQGQALTKQILRAYPQFIAAKADTYGKQYNEFTVGKTGQAINAYKTSIDHLNAAFDNVDKASDIDLNNPASKIHQQLGVDKEILSSELAKAVGAGSLTIGEKDGMLNAIDGKILGVATKGKYQNQLKEVVRLLQGKLGSFNSQWNSTAVPGSEPPSNLTDAATATQKLAGGSGSTQAAPAGATHIVPGPDGKNHYTNATGTVDLGVAP